MFILVKLVSLNFQVRSGGLSEMRLWLSSVSAHSLDSTSQDQFLLPFLRAQKFDVKKSQKMAARYLRLRSEKSHWFEKFDLENDEEIYELLSRGFMTVLPQTDEEGRIVVLNWASIFDPRKHSRMVRFQAEKLFQHFE